MKRSEKIFVLHGDVNRQSKILSLLGGEVSVVVWPGTNHDDVKKSLTGFDESRRTATKVANYMRRHGPFEPHRLPADEMEYTSLPGVLEKYH